VAFATTRAPVTLASTPLSTVDVGADLPVSTTKPQPRPNKPLFLTIKSDLSLALGNDAVSRVDCRTRLRLERSWTVSSALPSA
jgi:biopolymer transport protein ExbD